jgi:hypothetical protein
VSTVLGQSKRIRDGIHRPFRGAGQDGFALHLEFVLPSFQALVDATHGFLETWKGTKGILTLEVPKKIRAISRILLRGTDSRICQSHATESTSDTYRRMYHA